MRACDRVNFMLFLAYDGKTSTDDREKAKSQQFNGCARKNSLHKKTDFFFPSSNFSDFRVPIFSGVGFRVSFRTKIRREERRTKTNARTAQTNVLLNSKYLNFPIRCKN